MKKMHNYVIKVPVDDDKVLLFNSLNGAIVLMKKIELDEMASENYSSLYELNYYEKNENILNALKQHRIRERSRLNITISFNQSCNLACDYCSQNNQRSDGHISKKTLNYCIKYIEKCINEEKFKTVSIMLFGGEPLLDIESILFFKNKLESRIDKEKIVYSINTNGVLLTPQFLSNFEQLNVSITLSEKNDHDSHRVFKDDTGSYETILLNLINCSNQFNKKVRLILRYNVSNTTMDFEEFLISIKNHNLAVYEIELAKVESYSYNTSTNVISHEDYTEWLDKKGYPLLKKYGYPINIPRPNFSTCSAHRPFSIKICHDGMLLSCNYFNYSDRTESVQKIAKTPSLANVILDTKSVDVLPSDCVDCLYLLICGGKYACMDSNCKNEKGREILSIIRNI